MTAVHTELGRFSGNDREGRQGWLSRLSDEEAAKHPTLVGGTVGGWLPAVHTALSRHAYLLE